MFGSNLYQLEDFDQPNVSSGIEYLDYNQQQIANFKLSPNFNFKGFELGLDFNLFSEINQATKSDLESVVFRRVAYHYQNKAGFEWGRLYGITLGYGLLVDGYDTGASGSPSLTNKKAGFKTYANLERFGITGLWTGSNIRAARLRYTLNRLFGNSIDIGLNYIQDTDGVKDSLNDAQTIRSKQSAYSLDIGMPIFGSALVAYAEYAAFQEGFKGKGISTGLQGALFSWLEYQLSYRMLSAYFVPGYFNHTYESTAFSFSTDAPKKQISGITTGVAAHFLNYFKGNVLFESYEDQPGIITGS